MSEPEETTKIEELIGALDRIAEALEEIGGCLEKLDERIEWITKDGRYLRVLDVGRE